MKRLCLLIFLFSVSNAFFFNERNANPFSSPVFGSQFWKNFETGMKRFEETIGSDETGFGMRDDNDDGDNEFEASSAAEEGSSDHELGFADMFMPSFMGMRLPQPWWKGKNVCVQREEIDDTIDENGKNITNEQAEGGIYGSYQLSSCRQTPTKYVCTTKFRNHGIKKTFVVKYECCHGFAKYDDKPGCTKVDLKNMVDTIREAGAKEFGQLLRSTAINEQLDDNTKNFTVFAPADETLGDLSEALQEANQVEFFVPPAVVRRRRDIREGKSVEIKPSLKNVLLNHVTKGIHDVADFENNEMLTSESGHPLRINIYPGYESGPIYTINCGRITVNDRHAENGIVHIVDKVLKPVETNIAQLIQQDEKFTILNSLLRKADLYEQLEKKGDITLFAPTNEAFEKLDPALVESYLNGENCIDKILNHHILNKVLCTSGIKTSFSLIPQSGERYQIYKNTDGSIFVEDAKVIMKDIVTTNGVIHVIDKVILPNAGKGISQILSNKNLTTFKAMLEDLDIMPQLNQHGNLSLFIPSEAAFLEPETQKYLEAIKADKGKIKELVLYHSTYPEIESSDFENEKNIQSRLDGHSLRFNLYSSGPIFSITRPRATVDCARIKTADTKACGGIIHEIDRILVPPSGNLLETIHQRSDLSILNKIIKDTEIEEILKKEGPYTVLAPTDEGFNKLRPEILDTLLNNKTRAVAVMKQHIIPESLCCTGVSTDNWPWSHHVPVLEGQKLSPRRDNRGRVHFGPTRVVKCDQISTNGIIHTTNKVIIPQENKQTSLFNLFNPFKSTGFPGTSSNPNVEVFLFGI